MEIIKSYLTYLDKCWKKAFGASWDSANNLWGAVIVSLLFFANGTLPLLKETPQNAEFIKWENGTLTLIIYTVGAYIVLLIFRMFLCSPFYLYRKYEELEKKFLDREARKVKKAALSKLYREGVDIRAHFKVFENDIEWKPWGEEMDNWATRVRDAAYDISIDLGVIMETPNLYKPDEIPFPLTNHRRSYEQSIEISRRLNILDHFFRDEIFLEQQQYYAPL